MADINEIPGGKPMAVKRDLHFYWMLDTSGSMYQDGKIKQLNSAVREAIPHMQEEARKPTARGNLIVHALEFSDTARWVSADLATGVQIDHFSWPADLEASGETAMGAAFELLAGEIGKLPYNAFKPVIVLVTDGQPSDTWSHGLEKLFAEPWAKSAHRLAIAIGEDADVDVCQKFINNSERKPMRTRNIADIKRFIQFVTQVAAKAADKGEIKPQDLLPPPAPADAFGSGGPAAPAAEPAPAADADDWVS